MIDAWHKTNKSLLYAVTACLLLALAACSSEIRDTQGNLRLPAEGYQPDAGKGADEYEKFCATCHGEHGIGTEQGPPLVHRTYRREHHSDMSFYKAAQMGTYQHHWRFGNMPAVKNISPEQLANIIDYVRSEQAKAGIE